MEIDDDDDFYAPDEPEVPAPQPAEAAAPATTSKPENPKEDLEEGEEEDEGGEMDEDDDSDVDIVTERKDQAPAPTQTRYSEIRNIPQRSTSNDVKVAPPKKDGRKASASTSGADHSALNAVTVDLDAIPVHKGTGKPITQINMDQDLADKPWNNPGTDLSDYFNYGFNEFTWSLYSEKQNALRREYSQENQTKILEGWLDPTSNLMNGGMMPGMGGTGSGPGPAAPAGPGLVGMDGMPPEMQAMFQQMLAGGMDPNQMDPSAMSAMFAGMPGGAGPAGGIAGQAGQNQNFGGAGFGGNQGQGYGYDQQIGGGGNRGNFGGGRGRGRRNWQ